MFSLSPPLSICCKSNEGFGLDGVSYSVLLNNSNVFSLFTATQEIYFTSLENFCCGPYFNVRHSYNSLLHELLPCNAHRAQAGGPPDWPVQCPTQGVHARSGL